MMADEPHIPLAIAGGKPGPVAHGSRTRGDTHRSDTRPVTKAHPS